MATYQWYSFTAYPEGGGDPVFVGFFQVETSVSPNMVVGFYQTVDGTTDFNDNILSYEGEPWADADFQFVDDNFTYGGVNLFTTMGPSPTSYPYYNIFYEDEVTYIYGDRFYTTNVAFEPIDDPSCFAEGTRILCYDPKTRQEKYRCVETLSPGDLVKTYLHGYRPVACVGRGALTHEPLSSASRSGVALAHRSMYRMRTEDLVLTGGHGLLVDPSVLSGNANLAMANALVLGSQRIDDKVLLAAAVHPDFERVAESRPFAYYHFALSDKSDPERRYGVWANGVLCDTPSQAQFSAMQPRLVPHNTKAAAVQPHAALTKTLLHRRATASHGKK